MMEVDPVLTERKVKTLTIESTKVVKTYRKTRAETFIDAIRITNTRWRNEDGSGNWIFRGQANAEWPLVPAAWRSEEYRLREYKELTSFYRLKIPLARKKRGIGTDPLEVEVFAESAAQLRMIHDFSTLCNSLGLVIPDGGKFNEIEFLENVHSRDNLENCFVQEGGTRVKIGPVAAFAQHHGIPTALFDFTRDPLVAAYFSTTLPQPPNRCCARDVAKRPTHLAVWALNIDAITRQVNKGSPKLIPIEIPHHILAYLHAQDGLFLYYRDGIDWRMNKSINRYPSIDEILYKVSHNGKAFGSPPILRFTLPVSEVPRLVELLFMEKKSLAHMQPTYDNATKTVLQRLPIMSPR